MESPGTKAVADRPEWKVVERRRRVRHRVHTPAYASLDSGSSGAILDLSEILDISEEGMRLQTASPLTVGRDVNLCLDLSENKAHVYTSGHVIWCDEAGRSGVSFPQMPDSSLRQLKEWLFLNAMVGCMHHAAAAEVKTEPVPREQPPAVEVPVPRDYTSTLAGLAAVKREVETLGADLDPALQLIAERTQAFTHATGAAIALAQDEAMICRATSGPDAPGLGARLQAGSGFSSECIRTGTLLRCDDAETDPRVDRDSCRALGIRSMVAVPVRLGDAVIGLLEVFSPKAYAFNDSSHTVLQTLAEAVLGAVNRAAQAAAANNRLFEPAPDAGVSPAQEEVVELAPPAASSRVGSIAVVTAATVLLGALVWLVVPWVWRAPVQKTPRSAASSKSKPSPQPATMAQGNDLVNLRHLAEEGDPAAQFAVGAKYATGEEAPQDYAEAVRWFSMAAEQGHVIAQATLGAYYWAGRGVPQDLNKAYFWSILAQAGGDEASKYRVAVLASRMNRAQVVAAQQQANQWLKDHQLASKDAPIPR